MLLKIVCVYLIIGLLNCGIYILREDASAFNNTNWFSELLSLMVTAVLWLPMFIIVRIGLAMHKGDKGGK